MNHICSLFLFLTLMLLISCEKSVPDNDIFSENQSVNKDGIECIDGILHFKSSQCMINFMETQKKMSKVQFLSWEKSIGFKSYITLIEEIYQELDNAKTVEEFNSLLEKNSDLLHLVDDEVVPIVELPVYQRIINRSGNYFIDGSAYKVTPEFIYSTEEGCTELLCNFSDSNYLKANGIHSFRYMGGQYEKSSCTTEGIIQARINDDGNRKVKYQVTPYFFQEIDSNNPEFRRCYYCIRVETHTLKKSWLNGNFYRYNDEHHIRNFHAWVYAPKTPGSLYYPMCANGFFENRGYSRAVGDETDKCMTVEWYDGIIGAEVRYYTNGEPPTIINPVRINSLSGKAWSLDVPESQALELSYSCLYSPI